MFQEEQQQQHPTASEHFVFDEGMGSTRLGPFYARCCSSERQIFEEDLGKLFATPNLATRTGDRDDDDDLKNTSDAESPLGAAALAMPSGLSAVSTAINTALTLGFNQDFFNLPPQQNNSKEEERGSSKEEEQRRRRVTLLHGDELYDITQQAINYNISLRPPGSVTTVTFDVKSPNLEKDLSLVIQEAYEDGRPVVCIYAESCCNPSGMLLNYSALRSAKNGEEEKEKTKTEKGINRITLIVDNTFLSPVLHNPLDHGADVSVESMTKYCSGSSGISGLLATRTKEELQPYRYSMEMQGLHIPPDVCTRLHGQLTSVHSRVRNASRGAAEVTRWLTNDPEVCGIVVDCVLHSSNDHLNHSIYSSPDDEGLHHNSVVLAKNPLYFRPGGEGGAGSLWFHLTDATTPTRVAEVLASRSSSEETGEDGSVVARAPEFKTSFGGPKCRIDPYRLHPASVSTFLKARELNAGAFPSIITPENVSRMEKVFGTGHGCWCRLSIGWSKEAGKETIEALKVLFRKLSLID